MSKRGISISEIEKAMGQQANVWLRRRVMELEEQLLASTLGKPDCPVILRAKGLPYPETCDVCGDGPCVNSVLEGPIGDSKRNPSTVAVK